MIRDTTTATRLDDISGTGSLVQAGSATTTLSGPVDYTGATMIRQGTGSALAAGEKTGTGANGSRLLSYAIAGGAIVILAAAAAAVLARRRARPAA
jgi:autotransporter-associated beta strand protein